MSNYSADWRMRWLGERIPQEPSQILDVGGTAETLGPLASLFPGAKITAANVSVEGAAAGPHRVRADMTRAPFRDGVFDLVFLGEIIEHVYDLPSFLDELVRVAGDGASFAVTTPNLASWYSRVMFLAGQVPPAYTPYPFLRLGMGPAEWRVFIHSHDHIRVFTPSALREALHLHGIETIWWSGVTGYGGKFRRVRRNVERVLPSSLREGIVLMGRVSKQRHRERKPNRPHHSLRGD